MAYTSTFTEEETGVQAEDIWLSRYSEKATPVPTTGYSGGKIHLTGQHPSAVHALNHTESKSEDSWQEAEGKKGLEKKIWAYRDQIANIRWITEKAREFQKTIYFCFIDYAKAFDCGSQQTVENS